jgi:hypothetical protein
MASHHRTIEAHKARESKRALVEFARHAARLPALEEVAVELLATLQAGESSTVPMDHED